MPECTLNSVGSLCCFDLDYVKECEKSNVKAKSYVGFIVGTVLGTI